MDRTERIERIIERIETKVDALLLTHAGQSKDIAQNTKDLSEHIRRTNLLEGKMQKLWYAIFLGAGAALAQSWPAIYQIIKVLT